MSPDRTDGTGDPLTSTPTSTPTTGQPASDNPETVPAWAYWHCRVDDIFWGPTEGDRCWFCGDTGILAHHPAVTSQYGADVEAAENEKRRSRRAVA